MFTENVVCSQRTCRESAKAVAAEAAADGGGDGKGLLMLERGLRRHCNAATRL